jgi:DNA repair photolyase
MKKYTGHSEPWGTFVDVKVNACDLLKKQLSKLKGGSIIMSSVTDAYQPLERRFGLTRKCLKELLPYKFPVGILTKSPLVLRDVDLFTKFHEIEVGITITTDDERMRSIFEPHAPPIVERIRALRILREHGIKTYAFIGPVLPMNPEALSVSIMKYADFMLVDRMNYVSKTAFLFRRLKMQQWLDREFLDDIVRRLKHGFAGQVRLC